MANGGGRTLRPYESLFDGLRQVYSSRLLFPQAAVGIVGQALLLHRVIKDQTAEQLRNIAHQNSLPRGEKLTLSPKNMLPILSRCIGEVNVIFR